MGVSFCKERHFLQWTAPAIFGISYSRCSEICRTRRRSLCYSNTLLGEFSFCVQFIWIGINKVRVFTLRDVLLYTKIRRNNKQLFVWSDDSVLSWKRSEFSILCLPFHELCFSEQTFSIVPSTFKPKAQFIVLELRRISSVQRRARNIILAKNRRHSYFSLCPVGLQRLDSMLPITHPRSPPRARHLYEFGVCLYVLSYIKFI